MTAALAALEVHAELEEELIYPAWREYVGARDLVVEAHQEHHVAHMLIKELKKMDPEDMGYDAKFAVLSTHVTHHIKEEEGKMFPQAEKAGLDWQRLTKQVIERRQSLDQKPLWLLGVPVFSRAKKSVPRVRSFPADQEAEERNGVRDTIEKEAQMASRKEYEMEPSGKSGGQPVGDGRTGRGIGRVDRSDMDSATQAVKDTIRRTKRSARVAMKNVSEGIQTSTDYLTGKGIVGVVEDVEALIRRYPFQAFLIGLFNGISCSPDRGNDDTQTCKNRRERKGIGSQDGAENRISSGVSAGVTIPP